MKEVMRRETIGEPRRYETREKCPFFLSFSLSSVLYCFWRITNTEKRGGNKEKEKGSFKRQCF
jgi:hypothetical protein